MSYQAARGERTLTPPRVGIARLAAEGENHTVSITSMTVDPMVEENRSLPHDVMTGLVDRVLFESRGGQPPHAQAWSQTVQRRIEDIRSGTVKFIPGEETSAKIRRIVGR